MIYKIKYDFKTKSYTVYRDFKPVYLTKVTSAAMRKFIQSATMKTNGELIIYEKRRKNV